MQKSQNVRVTKCKRPRTLTTRTVTSLSFLTFTFWNYYVLKLLRLETIRFSDATLSDINIVLCYILSQFLKRCWAVGKSTCRKCPSYQHFPPIPRVMLKSSIDAKPLAIVASLLSRGLDHLRSLEPLLDEEGTTGEQIPVSKSRSRETVPLSPWCAHLWGLLGMGVPRSDPWPRILTKRGYEVQSSSQMWAFPTKLLAFCINRAGMTHRDWDAFYINSQSLHAEIIKVLSGRSQSKQINGTWVERQWRWLKKSQARRNRFDAKITYFP